MIPLILFLLGCAMIYVGTVQAAFTALMRLSLRLMAERAGRSGVLDEHLEDPSQLFVTTRLLMGVLLSLVAMLLALQLRVDSLHRAGLLCVSLIAFILVCQHLVPWLIVRRDPQRVLEVLLPSFAVAVAALSPVATALRHRQASRPTAAEADVTGEVLSSADAPVSDGGGMNGEDRQLLRSIVDFGDRLVREVMTPRPDIVAIHSDATLDELVAFFREQEYSRIPVYHESLDNILGFVFVKDLIKHQGEAGTTPVTSLMRPAYFVPETKRVPELLKEFQRRQVQSAIVVDEYGGTAGLVSLEDLIEEIVGEIRDEYDVEVEPVVDEGGGSFVFSGKADVDNMVDRLGIDIEREGFETVGGFLLARLGRVPSVGEVLEIDDLTVEVLEAERRRIHRVRIRRRQPVEPARA